MNADRQRWQEISSEDPDWVVLSLPDGKHGAWDDGALRATGMRTVEHFLRLATTYAGGHGTGLAVDVGCGVGRLTGALANHFDRVVGVDITPAMLERARARLDQPNVELRLADVTRDAVPTARDADLVVSERVLQHLPPAQVVPHLRALVRLARPGGVVVMQVPDALPLRVAIEPRRRLYGLLRRLGVPARTLYWRLGLHPMRMRSVPVATVREAVADLADVVGVEHQDEETFGVREAVIVLRRHAAPPSAA